MLLAFSDLSHLLRIWLIKVVVLVVATEVAIMLSNCSDLLGGHFLGWGALWDHIASFGSFWRCGDLFFNCDLSFFIEDVWFDGLSMTLFTALRPRFFFGNLLIFIVLSVELLIRLVFCLLTFALALRLHWAALREDFRLLWGGVARISLAWELVYQLLGIAVTLVIAGFANRRRVEKTSNLSLVVILAVALLLQHRLVVVSLWEWNHLVFIVVGCHLGVFGSSHLQSGEKLVVLLRLRLLRGGGRIWVLGLGID